MKLADLPTRVVRPLGEWEEPVAPKSDLPKPEPKTIKRTVKGRVHALLLAGVTSAPEMAERIGVTHQSIHYSLNSLKAEGKADCIEAPGSRAGRGSLPRVWVAI